MSRAAVKSAVVAAIVVAGCGGAPAPAPKPAAPTVATYAALAPDPVAPIAAKALPKQLQVALPADALPALEDLENSLGKAGLPVASGTSPDGYEIAASGARCTVHKAPRLADAVMPDAHIEPELQASGLSQAEAQALAKTVATAEVTCAADEGKPTDAAVLAEAVAEHVSRLGQGLLYDPQADRWWPASHWAQEKMHKDFTVDHAVRVVVAGSGERRWMGTRGMAAFGRPDLELFPVRAEDVAAVTAKLYVVADAVVQGDPIGPGSELTLGPAKAVVLDREVYARTLPAGGPTPPPAEALGPTHGRLALANPTGAQGDLAAFDVLVRRLTID